MRYILVFVKHHLISGVYVDIQQCNISTRLCWSSNRLLSFIYVILQLWEEWKQ